MTPETVHLVFKTHLDIGFTDHAESVRCLYHERFIPQALDTAEHFWREDPANPKFVWNTGAWLIHDHLETAAPQAVDRLESAIERGLIRWHGLPYTTHSELMSPALFRAGLSYSQELDARFGMTTHAAKMTDVPGHTLGIVPLMAAAGLRFLHLGVNSASPVPDLPDIFRWRAPDGSEIIVMYQGDYGTLHLPDGMSEALSFAHTHDNIGPQSVGQTVDAWRETAKAAPRATIRAATLEDYGKLLWQHRDHFPVYKGEIGDSWIHGAASDPLKLSRFRALQRLYDRFEAEGLTAARLKFGRELAMIAEHTWGVDIKTYLRDHRNFDQDALTAARVNNYRFAFTEASWREQRRYIDKAVAQLEADDRTRADAALDALAAPPAVTARTDLAQVGGWRFDLDPESGDIRQMTAPGGQVLRGAPLIGYRHRSYDHADLQRHLDSYLTNRPEWAILDHDKPGLENSPDARSELVTPIFDEFRTGDGAIEIHCHMPKTGGKIGAPEKLLTRLELREDGLQIGLRLMNKPANRMPEAGFWKFAPNGAEGWEFLRTGLWIAPSTCAAKGGGSLQAVFAARCRAGDVPLSLVPHDAALLTPTEQDFMTFPVAPPAWQDGVAVVLYNNKWGTNFPMWWEGDLWSRLHLRLSQADEM